MPIVGVGDGVFIGEGVGVGPSVGISVGTSVGVGPVVKVGDGGIGPVVTMLVCVGISIIGEGDADGVETLVGADGSVVVGVEITVGTSGVLVIG